MTKRYAPNGVNATPKQVAFPFRLIMGGLGMGALGMTGYLVAYIITSGWNWLAALGAFICMDVAAELLIATRRGRWPSAWLLITLLPK